MKIYIVEVWALVCLIFAAVGCHQQDELRNVTNGESARNAKEDIAIDSRDLVAVAGLLGGSDRESRDTLTKLLQSEKIEYYVYGSRGMQIYVSAEYADKTANLIRDGIETGKLTDLALLPEFDMENDQR